MKKIIQTLTLVLVIIGMSSSFASAAEPRAVPPNMIGLMLTPTGFDGKIYEPGQVDIGPVGWFANWGNKLVLIQRSGFAVKEQFIKENADDSEDHRCVVGPKRQPMSLDVRLLFALPDYTKPEGKDALMRMGLLGNPTPAPEAVAGGDRVLMLDASSVYFQQVQQQVRGKIRDVCIGYDSTDAVFDAIAKDGTPNGFTDKLAKEIGTVLAENHAPLFLVGAVASNVKPDKSVMDAIAADQAADKLVGAMTKIDDFIKADPTGTRAYIFKMNAMRAIVEVGEKNGNTFIFGDGFGKGDVPIAIPVK